MQHDVFRNAAEHSANIHGGLKTVNANMQIWWLPGLIFMCWVLTFSLSLKWSRECKYRDHWSHWICVINYVDDIVAPGASHVKLGLFFQAHHIQKVSKYGFQVYFYRVLIMAQFVSGVQHGLVIRYYNFMGSNRCPRQLQVIHKAAYITGFIWMLQGLHFCGIDVKLQWRLKLKTKRHDLVMVYRSNKPTNYIATDRCATHDSTALCWVIIKENSIEFEIFPCKTHLHFYELSVYGCDDNFRYRQWQKCR